METLIFKSSPNVATTYAHLKKEVHATLVQGRQGIEKTKVRTYWQTGKLIHEHVLLHQKRAGYGKQVVGQLALDLEVSDTVLYRCLEFARAYPMFAGRQILTWSHYRALLTVADKKKRALWEARALTLGWSAEELELKIRAEKQKTKLLSKLKKVQALDPPPLGALYQYQVRVMTAGEEKVDLGFQIYVSPEKANGFQQTKTPSYTYRALVERVVDGDTLAVEIDLGFGTITRQKLRLQAIDCPEMNTRAGVRAKAFVERELKSVHWITIKTSRSDKYDRYLADVVYGENKFLNQRLLDEGLAVTAQG